MYYLILVCLFGLFDLIYYPYKFSLFEFLKLWLILKQTEHYVDQFLFQTDDVVRILSLLKEITYNLLKKSLEMLFFNLFLNLVLTWLFLTLLRSMKPLLFNYRVLDQNGQDNVEFIFIKNIKPWECLINRQFVRVILFCMCELLY